MLLAGLVVVLFLLLLVGRWYSCKEDDVDEADEMNAGMRRQIFFFFFVIRLIRGKNPRG